MRYVILIINKWTNTESVYPRIFDSVESAENKIRSMTTENNNYRVFTLTPELINRPDIFPFAVEWWKPAPNIDNGQYDYAEERIRELEKAGALIAAEIDRIQNLYKP